MVVVLNADFSTAQTEILIPSTMLVSLHPTTSSHIPADCNTDTDRSKKQNSRCMFYLFIYLSFNNAAKAQDVLRLDRMIDEGIAKVVEKAAEGCLRYCSCVGRERRKPQKGVCRRCPNQKYF